MKFHPELINQCYFEKIPNQHCLLDDFRQFRLELVRLILLFDNQEGLFPELNGGKKRKISIGAIHRMFQEKKINKSEFS